MARLPNVLLILERLLKPLWRARPRLPSLSEGVQSADERLGRVKIRLRSDSETLWRTKIRLGSLSEAVGSVSERLLPG